MVVGSKTHCSYVGGNKTIMNHSMRHSFYHTICLRCQMINYYGSITINLYCTTRLLIWNKFLLNWNTFLSLFTSHLLITNVSIQFLYFDWLIVADLFNLFILSLKFGLFLSEVLIYFFIILAVWNFFWFLYYLGRFLWFLYDYSVIRCLFMISFSDRCVFFLTSHFIFGMLLKISWLLQIINLSIYPFWVPEYFP